MRPRLDSWFGKIHWRRDRPLTPVLLGFPCVSAGKESAYNDADLGLIPGFGRSPGEGNGYPLQHSGLENSIYRIVHGATKSRTQLSDFHFHFHKSLDLAPWYLFLYWYLGNILGLLAPFFSLVCQSYEPNALYEIYNFYSIPSFLGLPKWC